MSEEDPIGDMIVERFGRSTLPVRQVGGSVGTAFLFNELVESTPTDRPLALVSGRIGADGRGVIRWQGVIPVGFVGAPLVAVRELDGLAFGMHCVGLLLPGDRLNAVAPFSAVRALIDDIVSSDGTLPKRPASF